MKKLLTLFVTALFALSANAEDTPTLIKLFKKSGNTYSLPSTTDDLSEYSSLINGDFYFLPANVPFNKDQNDIIISGVSETYLNKKSAPFYIQCGINLSNGVTETDHPTDEKITNWVKQWQSLIRVKPNKAGQLSFTVDSYSDDAKWNAGIYQIPINEETTGKWLVIEANAGRGNLHTISAQVEANREYFLICAKTNQRITAISFTPASYTLSTADNDYYSLYLDYNAAIPSGVEAYTGTLSDNGKYLSLTKIEDGVIPANAGVLVKSPSSTGSYTFNATASAASATSDLKGVTTATEVSALEKTGKTLLTLGTKGGKIGFRKPAGGKIGANKAYLLVDTPNSSEAPELVIGIEDDETTGINGITVDNADVDAPMYNIAGQRVGNNAKGLVIKNGKKYMLK